MVNFAEVVFADDSPRTTLRSSHVGRGRRLIQRFDGRAGVGGSIDAPPKATIRAVRLEESRTPVALVAFLDT